jgi:hypothetical protein
VLHGIPQTLAGARVIAHLTRGVGWPQGGWLLADGLSDSVRRTLLAEGYDIMEDPEGRVIVEPPAVAVEMISAKAHTVAACAR